MSVGFLIRRSLHSQGRITASRLASSPGKTCHGYRYAGKNRKRPGEYHDHYQSGFGRRREQEDGIIFDPDSITIEPITEDADYEGVRARFRGHLDAARLTIQLDIGFGDKVFPEPVQESLPSLLNFPPAEMYCLQQGKHDCRKV